MTDKIKLRGIAIALEAILGLDPEDAHIALHVVRGTPTGGIVLDETAVTGLIAYITKLNAEAAT